MITTKCGVNVASRLTHLQANTISGRLGPQAVSILLFTLTNYEHWRSHLTLFHRYCGTVHSASLPQNVDLLTAKKGTAIKVWPARDTKVQCLSARRLTDAYHCPPMTVLQSLNHCIPGATTFASEAIVFPGWSWGLLLPASFNLTCSIIPHLRHFLPLLGWPSCTSTWHPSATRASIVNRLVDGFD